MSAIIEIPNRLDESSFESVISAFAAAEGANKVIFDAHACDFVSPYGLVGLLTAGQTLVERDGRKPLFTVPRNRDTAHWWARMGFFKHAADFFEIHGPVPKFSTKESKVLLEVQPVRQAEDVHSVVHHIQDKSADILTRELGLDAKATMGFGMALSEACQNIVEHAGTGGWVAVHAYTWRSVGRVVVIAVSDGGVGFRHTLEPTQAKRFGDRWGDSAALEAALLQSVSRFRDPGRGQGLAWMRRYLARWRGKITIRRGTARIAIVPEWDDDVPITQNMPAFPGAQVQIVVPAEASQEQ